MLYLFALFWCRLSIFGHYYKTQEFALKYKMEIHSNPCYLYNSISRENVSEETM